jgi:hypothetical protein
MASLSEGCWWDREKSNDRAIVRIYNVTVNLNLRASVMLVGNNIRQEE